MVVEAKKIVGLTITVFAFVIGAVLFTVLDRIAEKKGGGAGILLGIGLDSYLNHLPLMLQLDFLDHLLLLLFLLGFKIFLKVSHHIEK